MNLRVPLGAEPGYSRPHVVIQNDVFNRSRIRTVVVCLITSNLRRAGDPGNVLLAPGEGDLPEQSVVNVSQISTVDRNQIGDMIGILSRERVREIVSGIGLLLEPRSVSG